MGTQGRKVRRQVLALACASSRASQYSFQALFDTFESTMTWRFSGRKITASGCWRVAVAAVIECCSLYSRPSRRPGVLQDLAQDGLAPVAGRLGADGQRIGKTFGGARDGLVELGQCLDLLVQLAAVPVSLE